jgi:hypothetical protein
MARKTLMLNEHDNLLTTLKKIPKEFDGRVFLCCSFLAILLAIVNLFLLQWTAKSGSNVQGKWVAIWLLYPFLAFLIYLRAQQLVDQAEIFDRLTRSAFLLLPLIILFSTNFLKA